MNNKKIEVVKINNIEIKPFNINKTHTDRIIPAPLPDPLYYGQGNAYLMYINAKIGSGKSVLISNLLNIYKGYFRKIYFCSANIEINEEGYKIIKDNAYKGVFKFSQDRLYNDFNDKILNEILKDISETKDEEFNESEDIFLLIVDDLSTSFNQLNSLISKTLLRIRHIPLCVWVVSQRYKNIHPSSRGQITHFITFNTDNKKEIENMAETVGQNVEDFKQILKFCTQEQYSFLYIDSSKNPPKFYKNFNHQIIF